MSISANDLRRTLEFLENNETRLRRLETQEIGVGVLGAGMTLIEEITPTGETADFTSIPGTYRHLQLRWIAQSDGGAAAPTLFLNFNGDTGLDYWHTNHIGLYSWGIDPSIHNVFSGGSGPDDLISLGQIPGTLN